MKVHSRLIALVAMLVTGIGVAASPARADQSAGPEPADSIASTASVTSIPLLVRDSPPGTTEPAGISGRSVVGNQICFRQNVFDTACIQPISQDGVRWTGLQGSYAYGTGRPETSRVWD